MDSFPKKLLNKLWHSTTVERYESILKDGAILPEPELSDKSRWSTWQGSENYPYVRTLGGVSLFDFTNFNPEEYTKNYAASLYTFVPTDKYSGNKIWMEIDRDQVNDSLIEGDALLKKWKKENAFKHSLMPKIEAAHIGPIHLSKIKSVIQYLDEKWVPI